jgi:hypothetical protein
VWELAARRCRALGVGVLSGGYGQDELEAPGFIGFIKIPPTCCNIWTKWVFGSREDFRFEGRTQPDVFIQTPRPVREIDLIRAKGRWSESPAPPSKDYCLSRHRS